MTEQELDALIARLLKPNFWTGMFHGGGHLAEAEDFAPFQAADALGTIRTQLKTVLDREAETIRRYDAKLDGMEAELREARHERDGFHAERDLAREDAARLRKLGDGMAGAFMAIMETHREINPSNYSHDDACDLNSAFCEVYDIARTALAAWNLEALR